jgi:hypothetical protein
MENVKVRMHHPIKSPEGRITDRSHLTSSYDALLLIRMLHLFHAHVGANPPLVELDI